MQAPIRLSSLVRATAGKQSSGLWTKPTRTAAIQRNLVVSVRPLNLLSGQIENNIKNNKRILSLSSPSSSLFSSSFAVSRPQLFLRPYHVSIQSLDQQHRAADSAVDPNILNNKDTTATNPAIDDDIQPQQKNPIPPNLDPKARMLIGFTCTVCNHRSHKTMSKHAYQHGVVIMQCDCCKNRHLIADHLGWFKNGGVTVEDLVKEKGETVQKLTRSYQLIKDGSAATSATTTAASPATDTSLTEGDEPRQKTELELALEKASEGMLEWIPKDILQQEEEKMQRSRELAKDTASPIDKKD